MRGLRPARLPGIVAGPGAAQSRSGAARPMSLTGSILVVDDNAEMLDSIGELLRGEGYEVVRAAGGAAALALLQDTTKSISLVVLDMVMPGMHGLEVLDHKDADPRIRSIPVILLTRYTETQMKLHGGVVAILAKGAGIERLLAFVRAV